MEITDILQKQDAIILIKSDDLREFGQNIALQILSGQPAPQVKDEQEKPLTQSEAVEFLGKSRQTFHSWRKKGIIKAHILGGRVYYFSSELIAAMR